MTDYNWQLDGLSMFETLIRAHNHAMDLEPDRDGAFSNPETLKKHTITFIGKGEWKRRLYTECVDECSTDGNFWALTNADLKEEHKAAGKHIFPDAKTARAASVSGEVYYIPEFTFLIYEFWAGCMHIDDKNNDKKRQKQTRKMNPRSLANLKHNVSKSPR